MNHSYVLQDVRLENDYVRQELEMVKQKTCVERREVTVCMVHDSKIEDQDEDMLTCRRQIEQSLPSAGQL